VLCDIGCLAANSTGRFIMYSGITKMYYRKTVGHVFTKPVQIERTQFFFSSNLFFIVVHISAARRCECVLRENGRSEGEVVLCVGRSHDYVCGYCAT